MVILQNKKGTRKLKTLTNRAIKGRKIMSKPVTTSIFVPKYFDTIPEDIIEEVRARNKNNFGETATMFDSFKTEIYLEIMRRKKSMQVAIILANMRNEIEEDYDTEVKIDDNTMEEGESNSRINKY